MRLWGAVSDSRSQNILAVSRPWHSRQTVRIVPGSDDARLILSVALSSDGSHVISRSADQTLRLWDAVAGVHPWDMMALSL